MKNVCVCVCLCITHKSDRSVGGIDVDHDQRNLNIFLTIRRIESIETHNVLDGLARGGHKTTKQNFDGMGKKFLSQLKSKFSKQPRQKTHTPWHKNE